MSKLLIANWKMNPASEKDAVRLARAIDRRGVVIAPPFPFIDKVSKVVRHAGLGAQDMFHEQEGAFTGEVSPKMLRSFGVRYVIVGHSERRRWARETDQEINLKVKAALIAGLIPILCVGETKSIRSRGISAAKRHVRSQLHLGLKGIRGRLVIAYEPVWAISTATSKKSKDNSDTPEEAAEMIRFVRHTLGVGAKVVYGGSVNGKNAKSFLSLREVDGTLVGGASLRAAEFRHIIRIAEQL